MKTPQSRNGQRMVHCRGEIQRGCGTWPYFGLGSPLEPPFEPYSWSAISDWDLAVSGFDAPFQGKFLDRLKRLFLPARAMPLDLGALTWQRSGPLDIVAIKLHRDDESSIANTEQLLLSLGAAREPMSFEVFGIGPGGGCPARIETRFAASRTDLQLLKAQLHGLYPRSSVESHEAGIHEYDQQFASLLRGGADLSDALFVTTLKLETPYCFAIRTFRTGSTEPLAALIAVMEGLGSGEWALLQVTFCRARHAWAQNLRLACQDPYNPKQSLVSGLDQRSFSEKLDTPLYAASVILAANRGHVLSSLFSFVHAFQASHNRLALRHPSGHWPDDGHPRPVDWQDAVLSRQVLTPGLILNVEELASILRVPSAQLPSVRLLRLSSQTRQPPATALSAHASAIGQNVHRGQTSRVAIPTELRARHCYVVGATGTGKSTLLANMLIQDIAAGCGVGLLDPHGDLVKVVLQHIPQNRINDVVLFDAADSEYPIACNILEAGDETERQRIIAETVFAWERHFPSSWGPRLEQLLQYSLRTVLHVIPNATLADVERLLTDAEFRETTLHRTIDRRLLSFWSNQFLSYPKNATDPVLNKLSMFLLDRHVRNIICQRRAAVDFDGLLQGKILLVNLGLLPEKVAGILGSFLVTKIVNAAFRRSALPPGRRRPWHLVIDEFQSFSHLSVGFERIFAEARKQALTLTVANQHVGQLSPAVRQAIFGNVGSLIVFRLGVDDAQMMPKELAGFTPQDILNLEVGQAIARVGGSGSAFNLMTFREPSVPLHDPTQQIIVLSRQRYARPRAEVERELADQFGVSMPAAVLPVGDEPSDPNEDDLVA